MIAKLPTDPVGGHQAALVTSALLEMVGHQLVQAEVVAPALERGAVTLCDGFGFKNVVKVLRMAQLMPGAFPAATLDMLLDCALRTFGDPFMQPRIGLLLTPTPASRTSGGSPRSAAWARPRTSRSPADPAGSPTSSSRPASRRSIARPPRPGAGTCCRWTAGRRRRPSRRRSTSCSPPSRPT